MKYLFNSLQHLESDYSNALCPVQKEYDKSFMGNQKLLQAVTVEEFQLFSKSFFDHIKDLKAALVPLPAAPPLRALPYNVYGHFGPLASTAQVRAPSLPAMPTQINTSHNGHSIAQPSPSPPASRREAHRKQLAPIPGSTIEPLPRGRDGWKVVVKQWDEKLKDWDERMYKGEMRQVTAMNRRMREVIALEYIAYIPSIHRPFQC